MTYDLLLNNLLDEMMAKGSLPALNDLGFKADFSVANLIRNTLKTDDNVKYFFNLAPDDVEMLVNILE